jgi:hypothetical protein
LALYSGFIAAPIIAGLDKFFHILVDWTQYLAPIVPRLTGINAATFMMIVGIIEIVAGIVVAVKPKFGGLLVAAWLWGIIINLSLIPGFYDIALRDFVCRWVRSRLRVWRTSLPVNQLGTVFRQRAAGFPH